MSKPRPNRNGINELETVLRRWPYLPEHVKQTLAELVTTLRAPAEDIFLAALCHVRAEMQAPSCQGGAQEIRFFGVQSVWGS
jgi:hypothetical protein